METPARRQYLDLKARHPDALLWFRMGDFYETFDHDAEVMARDLNITLTSREFGRGNRVPMAGVPHHAATSYLRRLLAKGHRVAICEQLTEAGRGLVERDVVRVITPGTVVEPNLLAPRENNYLAALLPGREGTGLAYVDVTTGEFAVCQFRPEESAALASELTRLDPAEIIYPEGRDERVRDCLPPTAAGAPAWTLTPAPARWFHEPAARERLQSQFGTVSLEPFGCDTLRLAVGAAGATFAYVEAADRDVARLLRGLRTDAPGGHMTLDATTRRNLDLTRGARSGHRTGTVLHVLDKTRTPIGGRLLRRWLGAPLLDLTELTRRQSIVEALLHNTPLRTAIQTHLDAVGDLERTAARTSQGTATPRDLTALAASLRATESIRNLLTPSPDPSPRPWGGEPDQPRSASFSAIGGIDIPVHPSQERTPPSLRGKGVGGLGNVGPGEGFVPRLDPIPDVADLIERAVSIDADRRIKPGFHTELDSIAESVSLAQATLLGLERRLRERTNIRSLKVGYNKVFGYYIEVTKSNLRSVPADFVRRQTLANAERFVTEELQTCEAAILRAEERIAALEERVFAGVRDTAGAAIGRLLATAAALAELDVLASFAQVAAERRYVRPLLDNSGDLHIEGGRHPVVEASLEDGAFIANDCRLAAGNRESAIGNGESPVNKGPLPTSEAPEHSDTPISAPPTADCRLPIADSRILLITGPNMAGKSTYLRQVALIVLMAQVGSFVPAASARIGLVDRIFTRVGAHDDLAAGASTFLVEMVETAAILRAATSRSLLVFDEIGRGTSTFDGLSIAQAVVEDVHDRIGARTLFATHYHELTTLADRLPALSNANAAAVEEGGRVVFLHRIRPGGADRSYGIHVGEIAGLPAHVTARARIILAELEGKRTAALTPDPSPEFVRGEPDRHGPASISPTPAAPIDELGTSFELGSPLPLAGEGSGVRAALLTIDLARTTPLDALNLLARLQEQAQIEEAPGPPLRLVREHRDHQSAP